MFCIHSQLIIHNSKLKINMSGVNWYVLRAVAGQEKKVKEYLEADIARQGLEAFVPQILIPTETVQEMRNGKKIKREKTFFPGYILISADLSHGEALHTIKSIPGVIGFLEGTARDGEEVKKGKQAYVTQPMPLRQSEVNRILGVVDAQAEQLDKIETSFIVGEFVKVIDGAFAGFDGVIEQIFEDRKKLNVTVKVFDRNTPLELGYMQVEKQE